MLATRPYTCAFVARVCGLWGGAGFINVTLHDVSKIDVVDKGGCASGADAHVGALRFQN